MVYNYLNKNETFELLDQQTIPCMKNIVSNKLIATKLGLLY